MKFQNYVTNAWRVFALLIVLQFLNNTIYASVPFNHVFSPQQGLITPMEQPWRQEICLNGSWEFQPVALPDDYDIKNGTPVLPDPTPDGWSTTKIRISSP